MSLNRVLSFLLAAAMVAVFCSDTFAQGRGNRGPIKRTGKFLGLGWGNGNHWRAPATNPDYYNPYTAHNSNLLTGVHPDVARYGYSSPQMQTYQTHFYPSQPVQMQPANTYYTPQPASVIQSTTPEQPQTPQQPVPPTPELKGETVPTEVELEQQDEAHPAAIDDSDSGTAWIDNSFDPDANASGLFDQPVFGERDYQPRVEIEANAGGKTYKVDPDNFWEDN